MVSCSKRLSLLMAGVLCLFGGMSTQAQLFVQVGVQGFEAIVDESNDVLEGDGTTPLDLVHILEVDTNGMIHPPDVATGAPHPDNPLLPQGATRIGNQVPEHIVNPGWFGHTLPGAFEGAEIGGKTIFARVYNASDIASATFYSDSQTFTVPTSGTPQFWINVTKTDQPIDPSADQDGDTITDGDEIDMGTDPNKADTDGDGFDDPIEVLAGSSATNAASFLGITQLYKDTNDVWHLGWESADTKKYQPQYFERTDFDGPVVFQNIGGVVTASTMYTEILLPPQFSPPASSETQAFYRVYLDMNLP